MGMYDKFILKEGKCPKGHELKTKYELECQSKDLACNFAVYKIGKRIRVETGDSYYYIKSGKLEGVGNCEHCNRFYDVLILIDDGIFKEVKWIDKEGWSVT